MAVTVVHGAGGRERVGLPLTDAAAPDVIGTRDDRDQLVRAVRELPYRQRAVLVLRFWHDLTEQQAADVLGVRAGTVKSQTSRALQRLRQLLDSPAAQPAGGMTHPDIETRIHEAFERDLAGYQAANDLPERVRLGGLRRARRRRVRRVTCTAAVSCAAAVAIVATFQDWSWPAQPTAGQQARWRERYGHTILGSGKPLSPVEDVTVSYLSPPVATTVPAQIATKVPARITMVCYAGTGGCGIGAWTASLPSC